MEILLWFLTFDQWIFIIIRVKVFTVFETIVLNATIIFALHSDKVTRIL